jgi:uncharacterized protein YcbK (DUF882 family)
MGDLSKNFSRSEFACPHCGEVEIDPLLVATLQRIRDKAGPVVVTSGYRCPVHNEAVGGVNNSQHIYGRAADIYVPGMSQAALLALVREMTVNEDIYAGYAYAIKNSKRAVHVDVRIPESNTVRGWKHG